VKALTGFSVPGMGMGMGTGEGPGTGSGIGPGTTKGSPVLVAYAGPPGAVAGYGPGFGGGAGGGDGSGFGGGGPVTILVGGGPGGTGLGLPGLASSTSTPGLTVGVPGPGAEGVGTAMGGGGPKNAPTGLYVNVSGSYDIPRGVTGSDYQADSEGLVNLLAEVRKRTNVHVTVNERTAKLDPAEPEPTPVMHIRGHRAFSFTPPEREAIRKYVSGGGTILAEDSHGPFGECFRREMKLIFGQSPQDLAPDHELYRSYYVLSEIPSGDMGERYPIQGIQTGNRLGVIYSRNDYGGCWDGTGAWVKPESRDPAFKMGVNMFVYILAHAKQGEKTTAPALPSLPR
jgi:hypothetical protein